MKTSNANGLYPSFELILMTIFGAILLGAGISAYRRKKFLDNIPTSPICAVKTGLVEISGTIQAGEELISPLFGEKCCFFKSIVTKKVGKHTKTLFEKTSSNLFSITDGTGEIVVDPANVEVECEPNRAYQGYLSFLDRSFDPKARAFSSQSGYASELIFKPGQQVFLLGYADTFSGSRLILKKFKKYPFIISGSDEKGLKTRLFWRSFLYLGSGAVLLTVTVLLYLGIIKS